MKQFKHAALTLVMAGLLSAQAHASEAQVQNLQAAQPIATFSQTDINAMFEQAGRPMQLAALSQQEMKETEGAWWPILYYAPALSGAAWTFYQSSAYMPAYHVSNAVRYYWSRW
ncbi:hypothetical protein [Parazoarcus communis]|uniref:Uncharacterized protein n=1 Tax=Parazoarcus communis SWub3 = DSM 12120 TaxID=1121029 RepID=A0A323V1M6_9RHOO|nr:hypothetical protein [Parazoarcus communis]NMG68792.1 hypothetical protein [Parazoarcus communis SWub3 = DSM 12120]PZA17910.1 hypothetical protein DNK49_05175 [Azoarcus communis] [Parazoarcus communis SWub3 = DSM 12120]